MAASGAVWGAFQNSGQTCISANRMLVQEGIYEAFVDGFSAAVAGLKVADGFTEDQQFFLSFGQTWCAKERPEYASMQVTVDPHSPAGEGRRVPH